MRDMVALIFCHQMRDDKGDCPECLAKADAAIKAIAEELNRE